MLVYIKEHGIPRVLAGNTEFFDAMYKMGIPDEISQDLLRKYWCLVYIWNKVDVEMSTVAGNSSFLLVIVINNSPHGGH